MSWIFRPTHRTLAQPFWIGAATVAALALACCGAPRAYPDAASASAENSPSNLPPAPTPTTATGYVGYVSAAWKYSFEYPSSWFDVPNLGPLPGDKYFASINTESPEALGPDDIWMTISVDEQRSDPCVITGAVASPAPVKLTLDSEPTSEAYFKNASAVSVMHNNWCYGIVFLSVDLNAQTLHRAEIEHVLSTFRFNR